jgi:hypothetical protein
VLFNGLCRLKREATESTGTQVLLEPFAYDVWHDRAVFYFLTSIDQRAAYVRNVTKAVNPEARNRQHVRSRRSDKVQWT